MTIPIEQLLEKTGDPYHLVIAAARRTRQINGGAPKLTDKKAVKNTTVALFEIMEGKVTFRKTEKPAGNSEESDAS